jgi:hypothetical protein
MNEIDFEECLKDSPAYRYVLFFFLSWEEYLICYISLHRNQLRQATNHIDMLEERLEQVKKNKTNQNQFKLFIHIRCRNHATL